MTTFSTVKCFEIFAEVNIKEFHCDVDLAVKGQGLMSKPPRGIRFCDAHECLLNGLHSGVGVQHIPQCK